MPDTTVTKRADDSNTVTKAEDAVIKVNHEDKTPSGADGHSDFGHHDQQAVSDNAKTDQPSNRPGGITSTGILPPKSSGAGVDPDKHVLDVDTGLTATGSDHPGNGPSTEPLKPGEKPTLAHYPLEAAAVGARTPAVAAEEAAQKARNEVLQKQGVAGAGQNTGDAAASETNGAAS